MQTSFAFPLHMATAQQNRPRVRGWSSSKGRQGRGTCISDIGKRSQHTGVCARDRTGRHCWQHLLAGCPAEVKDVPCHERAAAQRSGVRTRPLSLLVEGVIRKQPPRPPHPLASSRVRLRPGCPHALTLSVTVLAKFSCDPTLAPALPGERGGSADRG